MYLQLCRRPCTYRDSRVIRLCFLPLPLEGPTDRQADRQTRVRIDLLVEGERESGNHVYSVHGDICMYGCMIGLLSLSLFLCLLPLSLDFLPGRRRAKNGSRNPTGVWSRLLFSLSAFCLVFSASVSSVFFFLSPVGIEVSVEANRWRVSAAEETRTSGGKILSLCPNFSHGEGRHLHFLRLLPLEKSNPCHPSLACRCL